MRVLYVLLYGLILTLPAQAESESITLQQPVAAHAVQPPHPIRGHFPKGGQLEILENVGEDFTRVRFEQRNGKRMEALVRNKDLRLAEAPGVLRTAQPGPPSLPRGRGHMTGRTYSNEEWLDDHEGHTLGVKLQRKFKVPMVVFFYTDWNEDAQMLKEQLYDTSEFKEAAHDIIKVRINPEHGKKDGRLAADFKLNKYPTTYVVEKIGAKPRKLDIFKKYFGRMKIEPLEHVLWNIHHDPRSTALPESDAEEKE